MTSNFHKGLYQFIKSVCRDVYQVIATELNTLFKDRGVVIMLVLAPLAYPFLYGALYLNETLTDVPIAVVDQAHSVASSTLTRHLDATQSLKVQGDYSNLAEAEQAFYSHKVHGVVFIPADFQKRLNDGRQTQVSIYCDISSFMYYRVVTQACNSCVLDMGSEVQLKRLAALGVTGEQALQISNPILYEGTALFNPGAGFSSFLLPIILILILHQTLFIGIGMLAGTSREENRFHEFVSYAVHHGSTIKVVVGKSLTYFGLYATWSFFVLGVIPRIFNLPHIGHTVDIILFMIPFLLAVIFFAMTISAFMPNRETSLMLFMFMSLILVFTSGIAWPLSNIHPFWKVFAWIFPSTAGVQAYIKVNTMSAGFEAIQYEHLTLWIQVALYFLTTVLAYRWQIMRSVHREPHKADKDGTVYED